MNTQNMSQKVKSLQTNLIFKQSVRISKALASHTRQTILVLLKTCGSLTSTEIQTTLNMKQSTVSRHLSLLKNSGIIDTIKKQDTPTLYTFDELNFIKGLEYNRQALDVLRQPGAL
jgi:DNA-binding transcriptional ArsR family regulator